MPTSKFQSIHHATPCFSVCVYTVLFPNVPTLFIIGISPNILSLYILPTTNYPNRCESNSAGGVHLRPDVFHLHVLEIDDRQVQIDRPNWFDALGGHQHLCLDSNPRQGDSIRTCLSFFVYISLSLSPLLLVLLSPFFFFLFPLSMCKSNLFIVVTIFFIVVVVVVVCLSNLIIEL